MDAEADFWLKRLADLKVDRAHGIAPHKPLLHFTLMELAEESTLPHEVLPLTGKLSFIFCTYWQAVAERRSARPSIKLPLYHTLSDECWSPLGEDLQPTGNRNAVAAIRFHPVFRACLDDPAFRAEAKRVLLATYFDDPAERAALCEILGLPVPDDAEVVADRTRYEAAKEAGREGRFRLTIVPAYDYTCALTRHRLVTVETETLVDAAHIHEFARSRNNDPRNGLALSKNAHWMFDRGLWSLTDDCRVLVDQRKFSEAGPLGTLLTDHANAEIHRPKNPALWPDPVHLAWHRKRWGFAA
jgi:putative restriction endonuclease